MCKYCEDGNNERLVSESEFDYASYKITGDKLEVWYDAYSGDSSFEEEIKLNNCPMCGKRLGKIHIKVDVRGQVSKSKKITWNKN